MPIAAHETGGYDLDIEPDRAQLARYGLTAGELREVVGLAPGGETVTLPIVFLPLYQRGPSDELRPWPMVYARIASVC